MSELDEPAQWQSQFCVLRAGSTPRGALHFFCDGVNVRWISRSRMILRVYSQEGARLNNKIGLPIVHLFHAYPMYAGLYADLPPVTFCANAIIIRLPLVMLVLRRPWRLVDAIGYAFATLGQLADTPKDRQGETIH